MCIELHVNRLRTMPSYSCIYLKRESIRKWGLLHRIEDYRHIHVELVSYKSCYTMRNYNRTLFKPHTVPAPVELISIDERDQLLS